MNANLGTMTFEYDTAGIVCVIDWLGVLEGKELGVMEFVVGGEGGYGITIGVARRVEVGAKTEVNVGGGFIGVEELLLALSLDVGL